MLVKALVLRIDKGLFYLFRNLVGGQIDNITFISKKCNQVAVCVIDLAGLICLEVLSGGLFHYSLRFFMKLYNSLYITGLIEKKTDSQQDAEHGKLGQVKEKASHVLFFLFSSFFFSLPVY